MSKMRRLSFQYEKPRDLTVGSGLKDVREQRTAMRIMVLTENCQEIPKEIRVKNRRFEV